MPGILLQSNNNNQTATVLKRFFFYNNNVISKYVHTYLLIAYDSFQAYRKSNNKKPFFLRHLLNYFVSNLRKVKKRY